MGKCRMRWTRRAWNPLRATLDRMLLKAFFCALLAGCVGKVSQQFETTELSAISASPKEYDGKNVRVEACLVVIIEGMFLRECGNRFPIFQFEAGPNEASETVFTNLVRYGHSQLGRPSQDILVQVTGVYRNRKEGSRFDHTIELTGFSKSAGEVEVMR